MILKAKFMLGHVILFRMMLKANLMLGHYLLNVSFSSRTSPRTYAGGRTLPLCHYYLISTVPQEVSYINTPLQS